MTINIDPVHDPRDKVEITLHRTLNCVCTDTPSSIWPTRNSSWMAPASSSLMMVHAVRFWLAELLCIVRVP
jgi:hypothetical protein